MEGHPGGVMDRLSDWKVCQLIQQALDGMKSAAALLEIWSTFGYREPSADERSNGEEVE